MGKDDKEKQGAGVNTGAASSPRRTDAAPAQPAVAQDTQASTPVAPAATPATTAPTAGNVATATINKAISKVVTPVVDADVDAKIDSKYTVTDEMRDNLSKPYDDTIDAYKRVMEALSPLESAEDRERRERSRRKIYAITDGLSALSNLYFTTQYAPNMYNHEKSMGETDRVNLERARAEREKNRDAHLRAALGIAKAQADKEQGLRKLEADMAKAKEAAKEAARKDRLFPLKARKLDEEGNYYASRARKAKEDADDAPQKNAAEIDAKKAKAEMDRSAARKNDRTQPSAGKGGKGGSGKGGSDKGFYVEDGDGNKRFITDSNIDREFSGLPEDVQEDAGNDYNKPNKEQKKQAIAITERSKTNKPKSAKSRISIHAK